MKSRYKYLQKSNPLGTPMANAYVAEEKKDVLKIQCFHCQVGAVHGPARAQSGPARIGSSLDTKLDPVK